VKSVTASTSYSTVGKFLSNLIKKDEEETCAFSQPKGKQQGKRKKKKRNEKDHREFVAGTF
jgi:hypothetical protein